MKAFLLAILLTVSAAQTNVFFTDLSQIPATGALVRLGDGHNSYVRLLRNHKLFMDASYDRAHTLLLINTTTPRGLQGFALMDPQNGKYTSAEDYGKKSLRAVRFVARTWEIFHIIFEGQDAHLISAANNKVVTVTASKTLIANTDTSALISKRGLAFSLKLELAYPSDTENCGVLDNRCPTSGTCEMGSCQCPAEQRDICDGECVATQSDYYNCGGCGNMCAEELAICVAGACQCPAGECDGQCFDLQSDSSNCGSCGTVCSAGTSCVSGSCQCPATQPISCNGTCTPSDDNNCGSCNNRCVGGASCVLGSCQCPAAQPSVCNGTCTPTQSDVNNCGSCNNRCAEGASCVLGSCQCPATQPSVCNGLCTPTQSDNNNCGSCNNRCTGGTSCVLGSCQCPAAQPSVCNGICTSTQSDNNNCGACGNKCPNGASCSSGTCQCPATQPNVCNGICTSTQSDNNNCGACGNKCPNGASCSSGTCQCPAQSPDVCNGQCTSMQSDSRNCGSCGSACPNGSSCSLGGCLPNNYQFVVANDNSFTTINNGIADPPVYIQSSTCGNRLLYGVSRHGPISGRLYAWLGDLTDATPEIFANLDSTGNCYNILQLSGGYSRSYLELIGSVRPMDMTYSAQWGAFFTQYFWKSYTDILSSQYNSDGTCYGPRYGYPMSGKIFNLDWEYYGVYSRFQQTNSTQVDTYSGVENSLVSSFYSGPTDIPLLRGKVALDPYGNAVSDYKFVVFAGYDNVVQYQIYFQSKIVLVRSLPSVPISSVNWLTNLVVG